MTASARTSSPGGYPRRGEPLKLLHRHSDRDGCREVARLLRNYVDREIDAQAAAPVAQYLGVCRRCGLAAETCEEIKAAPARRALRVDQKALAG